ncbi:MAG: putative bifunctional diguanylate cyclase/phosphodiesterase, partial [Acidimicrobiales bacterium]
SLQRKLAIGGELGRALSAGGELGIVYQPIALLSSGEPIRVEALARWTHPELGSIPADEFIAVAEQLGLIGKITRYVLSESCAQVAKWRAAGTPMELAVNLSGRDLSDDALVDVVAASLAESGLPAKALTLEITETEVMTDVAEARDVLIRLGALGVRIAIDDFGTGYSSLVYLQRLPLDELKIDRSFVSSVANDISNSIIVRSSITMAHSLGLSVVAEGAEDEVTCAILAEAGCDAVQGYYFSRPLAPAALEQWLEGAPRLGFSRAHVPPFRMMPGA